MGVQEAQVLDALRAVQDPDLHRDIVSLGFVRDVEISEGKVSFKIQLTTPACPVKDLLHDQAVAAVQAIPGVTDVEAEMTASVWQRQAEAEDLIPGVRQCVAIASGKGGVGKSTVTVNLAVALARDGARVGLMDADVYGPTIPQMMGSQGVHPRTQDSRIVPVERHGIKLMSLGFLLEEGQSVLWRGPMVAATVKQLLADVHWGDLDYLLVDLPPGTGDAPMSLAQLAPLSGVVIVSTPHSVSAGIAGKSASLFERLNAPLLGVVENMGPFACPHCGELIQLFRGLEGIELSEQLNTAFLGSVPFSPNVAADADEGVPTVIARPNSEQSKAFSEIARRLAAQISIRTAAGLVTTP